jgi:hypothetical protein
MLNATEPRIREVVLAARRTNWGEVQVVALEEGGYGMALDGEVVGCFHWTDAELNDCLATVKRLARTPAPRGT